MIAPRCVERTRGALVHRRMSHSTRGRIELYRSPNGDCWFLARDPANHHAFVVHEPNRPSGGQSSQIDIGSFLRLGGGPEHQALLRLIESLVSTDDQDSAVGT